ncbi:hypothetical protein A2U01_0108041, partial [Trifolium medium]|nr:hypothetical protein [Trifolium medium]
GCFAGVSFAQGSSFACPEVSCSSVFALCRLGCIQNVMSGFVSSA